ncbi:fluoride efflux transporter CrcB [Arenimonas sp.]|uniref:fluoride efflux transporter CrcB n=1 Tax=Arenimonas sp. TaxID=1872635 RepID=UPI0039E52787
MNLWWQQLLLVMGGGALGAAGRFLVGGWATRQLGHGFPWGTLIVNLAGAFAAGFLLVWLEGRGPNALLWRAFLMVGLLGGLTTFSALMVEALIHARAARLDLMLAYLAASLFGGVTLVFLGARLGESLRG